MLTTHLCNVKSNTLMDFIYLFIFKSHCVHRDGKRPADKYWLLRQPVLGTSTGDFGVCVRTWLKVGRSAIYNEIFVTCRC